MKLHTIAGTVASIAVIVTLVFAIVRFKDYIIGITIQVRYYLGPKDEKGMVITPGTGVLNIGNNSDRVLFIEIVGLTLNKVDKAKYFSRETTGEISNIGEIHQALRAHNEKVGIEKRLKIDVKNTLPFYLRLAPKDWANFFFYFGVEDKKRDVINLYYRLNGKFKKKPFKVASCV